MYILICLCLCGSRLIYGLKWNGRKRNRTECQLREQGRRGGLAAGEPAGSDRLSRKVSKEMLGEWSPASTKKWTG